MNKIEEKRKELEFEKDNSDGSAYHTNSVYLNGFNLGVKMAREEILDKIELIEKNNISISYFINWLKFKRFYKTKYKDE